MSTHVSNLDEVVRSAAAEVGRMLDETGETAPGARFTRDGIAPTETAESYGRRTHIVDEEDAPQGPPSPRPDGFTGQALHPFVMAYAPLLVGRCRHCWGTRSQHAY